MCSESSSHGLDEFLAEVQSLTKVHHRNLVSLVGYCWEKDRLALVYEYMSQGILYDHLRGLSIANITIDYVIKREKRCKKVMEGCSLHKGCSLPISHRDVKTRNVLLGQNLQAKIADFGLCKTYFSDTQTHISTIAVGTTGYINPEYYHTSGLTESSDVYSFGVILVEIATGEGPILLSHGHIIHRVKQKIASGNISSIADARLNDAYDVSSMWKVIDTTMACTSDVAVRRSTMAAVVVQLRESLALEEAREGSGVNGSTTNKCCWSVYIRSISKMKPHIYPYGFHCIIVSLMRP
ncbi:probable LRR receptor-like serine/threonine-protein kinase At1g51820 [Aegilops tauschii subsp. strangulata]|uniref:probable LRR receptor-like serine/threonine-protein kinase At1g51820 n=1 Tax=Aegilops tauschii subsp. strangulata TaxID=200361 RepID=UPI001ABCE1EB|nr:probable LRR receptor-like serine/threonine-protein kinase At1g51820 [Aegilops tauschii subsp. strangulata]